MRASVFISIFPPLITRPTFSPRFDPFAAASAPPDPSARLCASAFFELRFVERDDVVERL
jgi:hypothetical protein